MNHQTRLALNAINREFYAAEASAASFSATRDHAWPGWQRVWQRVQDVTARRPAPSLVSNALPNAVPSPASSPVSSSAPSPVANPVASPVTLLDVGCGNGRFAAFLVAQSRQPIHYLGVDASRPLLDIAARRAAPLARAQFVCRDLGDDGPAAVRDLAPPSAAPGDLRDAPAGPRGFDAIVVFGVLHHIPGFDARCELLAALCERLAPGGLLAFTLWRFGDELQWPRFQPRMLAWPEYNDKASQPLELDQLEAGDYLLRWGDATAEGPLRYCHYADAEERQALAAALPLEVVERYSEDGRSKDLNEYVLLRRAD